MKKLTKKHAKLIENAKTFLEWADNLSTYDRPKYNELKQGMNITFPLCELLVAGICLPSDESDHWIESGLYEMVQYELTKGNA